MIADSARDWFRPAPAAWFGGAAPAREAAPVAPAASSPLGGLVHRPSVWSRNAVRYLTVRRWASGSRATDLWSFKQRKAALDASLVAAAGDEIAALVGNLLGGWPGGVSWVAPGHSRRSDNFAARIAWRVAERLGRPAVQVFADRFCSGSSHPKANASLPPLRWHEKPSSPVLLVDDLATSGWHLEEALTLLRAAGLPALGIAWLGGEA